MAEVVLLDLSTSLGSPHPPQPLDLSTPLGCPHPPQPGSKKLYLQGLERDQPTSALGPQGCELGHLGVSQIAFFFSSSLLASFTTFPPAALVAFLFTETNHRRLGLAPVKVDSNREPNPSIVLGLERLPFAAFSLFS
ncbi:hypothetical protein Pyn_18320 [Prunus yedoensis var. nudiflora]|uniref:Uncharacterized protein n=1 Tax=Prunus yedoensis var. nudiflora TaxID=2094558 RepID=A0A314XZV8_PRUYE|nr:hypothetical protein Pyn_18320 [Prunus yedoensis var. nudiflora]